MTRKYRGLVYMAEAAALAAGLALGYTLVALVIAYDLTNHRPLPPANT